MSKIEMWFRNCCVVAGGVFVVLMLFAPIILVIYAIAHFVCKYW